MTEDQLFLLRFSGDVCTKARLTRHRFTDQIVEAVEDALAANGHACSVERIWSRLFVTSDGVDAGAVLQRVFGLRSVSPVGRYPWSTLDDIVAAGVAHFASAVAGRRFAVRARRTTGHPRLPFDSPAIERALGAELLVGAAGVDLDHPEVTAGVEVHAKEVYLYSGKLDGPAGLPIGVEGRALALISGGFDSAVACWETWKRGVALDFVFFNLGGAAHERGAVRVAERLARDWAYGDWPRLHAIELRPLLEQLKLDVKPRYWQLALKALMLLTADRLAAELRLPALVTGEAIGQVSSQTLPNLALLDRLIERLVLRPLLTANKDDIVALARRIGTYELSADVPEFCSLAAQHAATKGHGGELAAAVATFDRDWIASAVARRQVHEPRMPRVTHDVAGGVDPAAIPPGATVIDLRAGGDYREWHWPGALNLEYLQALRAYRSLDRSLDFVLYCEVGLKSAHLAELMQEAGLCAHHVPRGASALRRAAATGVAGVASEGAVNLTLRRS